MEVAALVVVLVAFLALIVALVYALYWVVRLSRERAGSDTQTISSLTALQSTTLEKALAFSDEQREVMRLQRTQTVERDDKHNTNPTVFVPVQPPSFVDGAENRVGD